MREIRTPGSMSGKERRSDGLLGERSNEKRCAHSAPPVLHATALLLDCTRQGERIKNLFRMRLNSWIGLKPLIGTWWVRRGASKMNQNRFRYQILGFECERQLPRTV
jgi:hypothetical protein